MLGYVLSGDTKVVDPTKLVVANEWPVPTTGTDVESFLGFTNYLRDHIPLYSELAAPLEKLRKFKVLGTNWSNQAQISFDTFRKILGTAPVLTSP